MKTTNAIKRLFSFLLALMLVLTVVLLIAIGENLMFLIPLACATAAMIIYHSTSCKFFMVLAIGVILLHAFSFYFALAMALTVGAYGAVAMLVFFGLMVLIPLADLYMISATKKK